MFESVNLDGKGKLIELLFTIVEKMEEITEFSESELKAISILESDEYLSKLLTFYKENKKHVKRKHSDELLEALRSISTAMNDTVISAEKRKGWFH